MLMTDVKQTLKRKWSDIQPGQTVRTTEGKIGMKIEAIGILTQEGKLLYVYDTEPCDLVTDINQQLFFVRGDRVHQVSS